MPLRRARSGPIRRSQFGPPELQLREALADTLAAIAARDPALDARDDPPEIGADSEPEDPDVPSDDEDDASSSGVPSPETSPPSSPVASPTTAAPATLPPSSLPSSAALSAAPSSTFRSTSKEEEDPDDASDDVWTLHPQPTSVPASASEDLATPAHTSSLPTGTDVARQSGEVWIMEGPPPKPPSGISQSTEHLLIAVGSIGATLLVVIIIFGVYTMRKKGLTFRDLVQMSRRGRTRPDRTFDIAKPTIHRMPAYAYEDKEQQQQFNSSYASLPRIPQSSMIRVDSVSSSKPGSDRHDALSPNRGRRPSTPKASNRSFFEDSTPPRGSPTLSRSASKTHSRDPSSPPVLPLQRRTRGESMDDGSPPTLPIQRSNSWKDSQPTLQGSSRYNDERDDIVSPEAPGPIYQQFTASRRFTATQPNYKSHFSWTQSSQAPPTPIDPTPTGDSANGRISVATTASSVARFRTVDSWVGQQAGRIPSTQLRNQPHWSFRQSSSTSGGLGQVDEGQPGWQPDFLNVGSVPDVPDVPSKYKEGGGHSRQPTNYSDATVFRQHPGTEIKIPRGSLVPSEVLDEHMVPSAL